MIRRPSMIALIVLAWLALIGNTSGAQGGLPRDLRVAPKSGTAQTTFIVRFVTSGFRNNPDPDVIKIIAPANTPCGKNASHLFAFAEPTRGDKRAGPIAVHFGPALPRSGPAAYFQGTVFRTPRRWCVGRYSVELATYMDPGGFAISTDHFAVVG